ncbi:acyl-CoA dehydrogenase family protein [Pseudonocardia sp. KRD291]|uniref:acyl-CoA dehydrogenase family protein n=1 Tax=Pseudonocardia sp. KRD291 TaxID=2792007 RepID=UPI001C4A2DDD|nr:acyl-CoA dehydrogenase family protein [Pseudonocardia sp. KRD291]MBW0101220.1 acyl-CoA dehydrogenase [Pseudonocardia sp. KRD291]
MKTQLTEDALELERVMDTALRRLGGVDLARAAEAGAGVADVTAVLGQLDVWDLRPRTSPGDGEMAAAVCRAAGRVALPYPVAERLAADPDEGFDAIAVATGPARVNLVGVVPDLRWAVSDGVGSRAPVVSVGPALGTKLGALVSEVELGESEPDGSARLALLLPCWTLLGMLETALAVTRRHMLDRRQFDQPIASFQALQFRLADTTTSFQAFEELTKYTLWSVLSQQPGAAVDVLACRVAALEVAETVFRTSHQMHGAVGFCDEVDLSWLSRYSQPIRRLPWGLSQTRSRLLQTMTDVPFTGLHGDGLVGSANQSLTR